MRQLSDGPSSTLILSEFDGSTRTMLKTAASLFGCCLVVSLLASCGVRDENLNPSDRSRVDFMCKKFADWTYRNDEIAEQSAIRKSKECSSRARVLFIEKYRDISDADIPANGAIVVMEAPSPSHGVSYSTPGINCSTLMDRTIYLAAMSPNAKDSGRVVAKISEINRRNAAVPSVDGKCWPIYSEFGVR